MNNPYKRIIDNSSLTTKLLNNMNVISNSNHMQITKRHMNRNARRPKKANHGKRPCSHVRRRLNKKMIKTRRKRKPLFSYLVY